MRPCSSGSTGSVHKTFTNLQHHLNDPVMQHTDNKQVLEIQLKYKVVLLVVAGDTATAKIRHKKTGYGRAHHFDRAGNGIFIPDYRLVNHHFPAPPVFPVGAG